MKRQKPDFLCIGFHKCGTTWLNKVLSEHPEISMPLVKEIDYLLEGRNVPKYSIFRGLFDRNTIHRFKRRQFIGLLRSSADNKYKYILKYLWPIHTDSWYKSLFHSEKISGDVSPTYCFLKSEHVEDIAQRFPHLKIIICLREPTARMWSHVKMNAMLNRQPLNPESISDISNQLLSYYPKYLNVIKLWQKFFPKVHILFQEDIATRPASVTKDVFKFLDCQNTEFLPSSVSKRVLKGSERRIPSELKTDLIAHFTPSVIELSNHLKLPNKWRQLYISNTTDHV